MKAEKILNTTWFKVIIILVVMFLMFQFCIASVVNRSLAFNENCNLQYGKENWEVVETTGTGICSWYIGQCWECRKITTTTTIEKMEMNLSKPKYSAIFYCWVIGILLGVSVGLLLSARIKVIE